MTNAELAILSLVAERPRHGYEIEQVIEERGMREWTEIGFSSIYYLLKKLEREGLVKGQLEKAERGPARKVYHITPAGTEAQRTSLLHALSVPYSHHSSLLLGIAGLPAVSPAEAITALRQYRDALTARLANVQTRRENLHPLPYFVDALFGYSIMMIETELKWVAKFIKQVQMEEQNA
jgi:DNA-binding PadR family transcriptional regulator